MAKAKKPKVLKDSPALRRHKRQAKNDFARLFPELCLLLKASNCALVEVDYAGSGDSGSIDDIRYYTDINGEYGVRFDDDPQLDPNSISVEQATKILSHVQSPVPLPDPPWTVLPQGGMPVEVAPMGSLRRTLDERVTRLCEDRWDSNDDVADWSNNEGGGTLKINVIEGTLTAAHHYYEQVEHNADYKGWGKTRGEKG